MGKGGGKYDEEMERAKAARDPEVTKKSKWAAPSKGSKPDNPNQQPQYSFKPLLGGEKKFYGAKASRASKWKK